MRKSISLLLRNISTHELAQKADVIPWASPVPVFGNVKRSKIGTLGLNPSNREFVDIEGKELSGAERRFHTLSSLSIRDWKHANDSELRRITKSCEEYFLHNPYNNWFQELDSIINSLNASYYGHGSLDACHLDLIPYATNKKWTNLSNSQRKLLLEASDDGFAQILKDSEISLLVLNGISVVRHFENVSNIKFKIEGMDEWTLPRQNSSGVPGVAFYGHVTQIGKIKLKRKIMVIGFNHNIQSSFGVTKNVKSSIRKWVGDMGIKAAL